MSVWQLEHFDTVIYDHVMKYTVTSSYLVYWKTRRSKTIMRVCAVGSCVYSGVRGGVGGEHGQQPVDQICK
jgi:hypothetical protein